MAARGRGLLVFQVLIMKYCKGDKSCIEIATIFIEIATIMMGLSVICFSGSQ